MRPWSPGTRSSSRPNASKPADGVLGGVRAIDAEDEDLGALVEELGAPGLHAVGRGECVELGGVDRDRVRVRDALRIGAATEQHLAALDECGAPPLGVEADAVACEQALVDRLARSPAGAPPRRAGATHGMCVKCAIRASGAGGPDERGHEVEVVVVDEDRRIRGRDRAPRPRGRERPVGLDVPSMPGRAEIGVRDRASDPTARAGRTTAPGLRSRRRTAGRRRRRARRGAARTASPTAIAPCARPSAATSRSTSPIALATQVTSGRSTSGRAR